MGMKNRLLSGCLETEKRPTMRPTFRPTSSGRGSGQPSKIDPKLAGRGYFSEDDITTIALITKSKKVSGKRNTEEKVVNRLMNQKSKAFTEAYNRIRSAEWYIISARKADDLFRKMFIERVYALRVRNFSKAFGAAEVDMHFSLKNDLTSLNELFKILRDEGPVKTGGLLERGTL
jgi:hypothetical protein